MAPIDRLPLELRPYGRTGLRVHPIAIGCAPLGNTPDVYAYEVAEQPALEFVRAAFDGPINFLDTAASYGDGESERRIGLVLRERGGLPPGFVLATKADRDPGTGEFSGDQMRRSVERSLRLLGLNSIQICYLHDAENTTYENVMSKGGPLDVLLKLKDEGLIEHIGVAGGPIHEEIRYVETGAFESVITHNRYNLLNLEADPLLDVAIAQGVAVVNAAPYGSGMLAKGPNAYPRFMYEEASPELIAKARRYQEICARYDVPLPAVALQFSLREPRITSTIVGMTRTERLQQTLDLASYPIPDDLWAEIVKELSKR